MSDETKQRRNLHVSIDPSLQPILRAQAALEEATIGEVVERAIAAYCSRLAALQAAATGGAR